jgi:OPA family glycerol-3-phosphate transporter-like MFS transporter 3
MALTASIMIFFGLAAFANIHSLGLYTFLWALNGLIQSIGWPANVAVMYGIYIY